ncbi:MAG: exodeoxyribonuclease I [Gammaproteobacteria bacterium]|nr:exodeoxyribonuclease I [Gammaproteobacteria bacterium]
MERYTEMNPKAKTLYWYDLETFGINPVYDRISQFSGVRTDENLNIIGQPLNLYCKPADDMLPSPEACLITGITPQIALEKGVPETEFIKQIHDEFLRPNTCVVGYNNIRFDDEFTRYTLYRNLLDPYAREWKNGNSRWDIIDMVRLTRALRPQGIHWPTHSDGRPSIKLEDLTVANGIVHDAAHDALSDVYATIAVAKMIKDKHPKLYDYAYQNRSKHKVGAMLNMKTETPVLHISGMYPTEFGNTAIVTPVALHPTNKNGIIVFDLRYDPQPLFSLSAEEIQARLFTPTQELPEGVERIPLKTVHLNKCPVIAPVKTLNNESAECFKIDIPTSLDHHKLIKKMPDLQQKIQQAFSMTQFEAKTDPDTQLYSGAFFENADKEKMEAIHNMTAEQLAKLSPVFNDSRLPEMLFRYRARNFPDSLSNQEKSDWNEYRKDRLTRPEKGKLTLDEFYQKIEAYRQNKELSTAEQSLLNELESYGKELAS